MGEAEEEEEAVDHISILRSQIQNLRFGGETLSILESLLVSRDVKSLLETRAYLGEFLRSESVAALRSIAGWPLVDKLSALDFFVASFALLGDAESCLALKYEALILRELKHMKFPSLRVSFQEWEAFSDDSFDNGFYSMAVQGYENVLTKIQKEADEDCELGAFSSRQVSVQNIKELRDQAQKLVASESEHMENMIPLVASKVWTSRRKRDARSLTRAADYLRNKTALQNKQPARAAAGREEFATSTFRLGIKKRNQKRLQEIKMLCRTVTPGKPSRLIS